MADLWEVWSKHYEGELEKSDFKTRTQSSNPDVACMALRRLANYFGRGKKVKKSLKATRRGKKRRTKKTLLQDVLD